MSVSVAFDPKLQEELACLVLNNPGFASKFNHHVLSSEDIQKKKIQVFTNLHIDRIVKLFFYIAKKSDGFYPSEGIILSEIDKLSLAVNERDALKKTYHTIKNKGVVFNDTYNNYLKEFVTVVKTSILIESIIRQTDGKINNKVLTSINEEIKKHSASIEELRFVSSNIINMGDIHGIIEEYADSTYSNIPLGLPEIDRCLNGGGEIGGMARGEVTVFISGTNDGKSFVVNGVACNAVERGFSVVEFAFEGKKLQTPIRAVSNIAKLSSKKIQKYRELKARNKDVTLRDFFSPDEIQRIEQAEKIAKDKFLVIHAIEDSTIESITHQAIELYRSKPFDLIIIDYGQLVESLAKFVKEHELLMFVFRQFEKLAAKLNVAIGIAMQVNRDGITDLSEQVEAGNEFPVYKLSHVAGGYGTLKTAGCVIAISRTLEERTHGKARFTIIKQREGLIGVEVGIKADFDKANMFSGERYRYFHPVENAMGIKPDIFEKKQEGVAAKPDELVGVEEIQKAINNDSFFKGLSGISLPHKDTFYETLNTLNTIQDKIKDIEATLGQRATGKIELDLDEMAELEKDLGDSKVARMRIINSDDWMFHFSQLISKLTPFVNKIEEHSKKELFKVVFSGEFKEFDSLKLNLEIIGMIKMLRSKGAL